MVFASGDTYGGNFVNGQPHGVGKHFLGFSPRLPVLPIYTIFTLSSGRPSMWHSITSPLTTGPTFSGVPE